MSRTYYNRFGTPFKIIDFIDGTHVTVEFLDEYHTKVNTVIEAVKNGRVKIRMMLQFVGLGL